MNQNATLIRMAEQESPNGPAEDAIVVCFSLSTSAKQLIENLLELHRAAHPSQVCKLVLLSTIFFFVLNSSSSLNQNFWRKLFFLILSVQI